MAISLVDEKLVSFAQLARSLPRRRQGRPVHVSTVHRWRRPGVKGICLEAIRVGGAWHTTWESFQKFCEQLTRAQDMAPQRQTLPLPRACPAITRELEEDGW